MRMLPDPIRNPLSRTLAAGALVLALAAPATAGTVFGWTTDEGVAAYTNDPKRVPARYKDSVKRYRLDDGLNSYARFTPRDRSMDAGYERRLYERLERLRALNAHLDAAHVADATTPTGFETTVRLNRRGAIRVRTPMRDAGPIVVDERRVKAPNRSVTRHVTVVRQGDRVISVVRPQAAMQPLNHGDEEDLLR